MTTLPRNFRDQAYHLMDEEIDQITAEMTSVCESPIEVAFAVAVIMLGHHNYGMVGYLEGGYERDSLPHPFEWILALQRKIDNYRVDFILSGNPIRSTNRVIIECDGHNFHERTKEQAARDRSRDRDLQAQGYKVFRFTGSEIYRDAFACATEAFEALLAMQAEEKL